MGKLLNYINNLGSNRKMDYINFLTLIGRGSIIIIVNIHAPSSHGEMYTISTGYSLQLEKHIAKIVCVSVRMHICL